ncbi:hypothetical protein OBV_19110 [Oscillibacter valericigenes Sjm18-20]|nr:hypothetical protein OBV_19110 [Oscillibacter valericigenes Sjm18-20]
MKRALALLSAAALTLSLTTCSKSGSSGSSISGEAVVSSAPPELTEADVLAAYDRAAEVYDWFDLYSLPASGALVTEDGQPYDSSRDGISYQAVDYDGLNSYADLDIRVRSCFSPELADEIMGDSINYRDIGGKLYTASGARGSNLYLLDKTVAAEQVDENRWTVTLTFFADSYELDPSDAVIGYSQKTLDYVKTTDGWRFSAFCPSDALDETADTVFRFSYDADDFSKEEGDIEDWSDLQLACWLLHADGAFSEGPSDTLSRRFLYDPGSWFAELSVFPDSPWKHADDVMKAPAWDTYTWFTPEDQAKLDTILDAYQPKNDAEQALLDGLKTAWMQTNQLHQDEANSTFCLVANDQCLTLGKKGGDYPWLYTGFPETPTFVGKGDNGEICYTFSYGGVDVDYYTYSDTGGKSNFVSRMETSSPAVKTWWGVSVGDGQDAVLSAYPEAAYTENILVEDGDGAWVWPGDGEMLGSHITFYMKGDTVSKILMENLSD